MSANCPYCNAEGLVELENGVQQCRSCLRNIGDEPVQERTGPAESQPMMGDMGTAPAGDIGTDQGAVKPDVPRFRQSGRTRKY